MKRSELEALIAGIGSDESVEELFKKNDSIKKFFETPAPPTPPTPPAPPVPPTPPVVKADTSLTMTAAEFMQLIEKMNPPKPEPKKGDEDDAEIYIN